MHTDSRKMHIIEALLKVEDEQTLSEMENVIAKHSFPPDKIATKDLFGIWSKEEAETIEKAIEDGCERIHPDGWK